MHTLHQIWYWIRKNIITERVARLGKRLYRVVRVFLMILGAFCVIPIVHAIIVQSTPPSPEQQEQQKIAVAAEASSTTILEATNKKVRMAASELLTLRCPGDYEDVNERARALFAFTNDFYAENPQASGTDYETARMDFYITHRCYDSLRDYGYGLDGPITPQIRQQLIDTMRADVESGN